MGLESFLQNNKQEDNSIELSELQKRRLEELRPLVEKIHDVKNSEISRYAQEDIEELSTRLIKLGHEPKEFILFNLLKYKEEKGEDFDTIDGDIGETIEAIIKMIEKYTNESDEDLAEAA